MTQKTTHVGKDAEKGNPITFLLGMQTGTVTLENTMTFPPKVKNKNAWVAQVVKCLPLAQVMIPGSWE